jgi:thiosulfate/3-mercaptopyruvate sulfurtransferase
MDVQPRLFRRHPLSRRHLLLGAGTLAAVGLSGCRGASIETVAPEPVAAFPGLGDPPLLVDVGWFRERRAGAEADRLVVLDLSDLPTYREGHVPGAIHAWWQDWIDPYSDIYGVLLGTRNDPNAREDLLNRLGIDNGSIVVAYDADQNRYAAHMVWILRYLGLPEASVLDGGLGAWRGARESSSTDGADPRDAEPVTLAPATDWTVPWDEMVDRYSDPTLTIVDVRTDDEADDDLNGLLHHGMIPGAIRLPWTRSLRDEAGRLLAPDTLAAQFRDAGILPEDEVAVVARFGVEAGQTWLVLSLLGYERVRVFDRGWAHWGRKDIDVPIADLTPLT